MLEINKNSPIPIYYQISSYFMEKIKSGELKINQQLPSEGYLADALNISKMTARQAINELADNGYVLRIRGKGTFVTKPRIERHHQRLRGFFEDMSEKGLSTRAEILTFNLVRPNIQVQKVLDLGADEQCIKLERVKFVNNEAIAVEHMEIVETYCPDLFTHDLTTEKIFEIFENGYGLKIDYAKERVQASQANKIQAQYLGCPLGSLLIEITRIVYLAEDKPLIYIKSFFRNDRYTYASTLYR